MILGDSGLGKFMPRTPMLRRNGLLLKNPISRHFVCTLFHLCLVQVKIKRPTLLRGTLGSVHLPFQDRGDTTVVCDVWPVRRQTYSYLPSRRAPLPFSRYQIIMLGGRGTSVCVNDLSSFSARKLGSMEWNGRPVDRQVQRHPGFHAPVWPGHRVLCPPPRSS